ncbi:CD164 sialomucin-like 2 protein [Engraulis encrasicolus]|uniref:CD164 sialomucin-like 2 protein n=1 Tax=Engraulis encrasicolus TaxID=184585 RepID=UPI002FD4FAEE
MRGFMLVLVGTLVTLEVIQLICAQTAGDGDCAVMDMCDQCVSLSFNSTRCIWRICDNENLTGCVTDKADFSNCNRLNETAMCSEVDIDVNIDINIEQTDETKPAASNPEFSQASFDLSSFIGGIILVLVLQAGGFFAMRFLKTKDSTYETIDQPQ